MSHATTQTSGRIAPGSLALCTKRCRSCGWVGLVHRPLLRCPTCGLARALQSSKSHKMLGERQSRPCSECGRKLVTRPNSRLCPDCWSQTSREALGDRYSQSDERDRVVRERHMITRRS